MGKKAQHENKRDKRVFEMGDMTLLKVLTLSSKNETEEQNFVTQEKVKIRSGILIIFIQRGKPKQLENISSTCSGI